jgi:signal transduction histidine kinase
MDMSIRWYIAAGITACALANFACQPAVAMEPKRVVLIYNSVGFAELLAGNIRNELMQRSPGLLEIYSAPFAAASAGDEGVTTRYADYLGALFPGQRIDLAVTVGSPAMNFFRQYGRQFFPSTPMLAVVQEARLPSNLAQVETAAVLSFQLIGALENIIKVLPETTNVSVVIGNSPLEQFWLTKARSAYQPFVGRLSFRWLNDLSFDDILKHAATLPPRSAVLYINLLRDALGAAYSDHEVVSKLRAIAKAPIFTFDDADFGQGIMGGPMLSTQDIGRDTTSIALRILSGEALGGVTFTGIGFNATPKYDWREMQRWGISESSLPPGSQIYFRDPTAWERYHWQIVSIAAALLLQTLLIIGLFYERHRRRNAEATSRQHLSELAHMNRNSAAGELSASIAHEMLQPLTAIVAGGNAGLRWLAKAKPNLDKARASIEGVIVAAEHAGNVIRTIRSMFKKSDDEKVALNPNRLIQEVLELLRVNLRRRGISVETRLSADLPEIMGNRVQLQQVILNLLVNAADAMDSVTERDRMLKITANRQEPSGILITIEDSGPGVAPENIERIFEPFYTTKSQGMGMGLTICRSIVEAHGGSLVAASSRSGGLAMQISLPASANRRVLLVEDEAAE